MLVRLPASWFIAAEGALSLRKDAGVPIVIIVSVYLEAGSYQLRAPEVLGQIMGSRQTV